VNIERIESAPGHMAGHSSASEHGLSMAESQGAAQLETVSAFLRACQKADANELAPWAPAVNDYSDFCIKKRIPALHSVMTEAMDFPGGPTAADLMQILLDVAHGDASEAPEQARALLGRMASTWAKYNTEVIE
jgi:hypothetical protein